MQRPNSVIWCQSFNLSTRVDWSAYIVSEWSNMPLTLRPTSFLMQIQIIALSVSNWIRSRVMNKIIQVMLDHMHKHKHGFVTCQTIHVFHQGQLLSDPLFHLVNNMMLISLFWNLNASGREMSCGFFASNFRIQRLSRKGWHDKWSDSWRWAPCSNSNKLWPTVTVFKCWISILKAILFVKRARMVCT